MNPWIKRLFFHLIKSKSDPLITVNVSRSALLNNLSEFQKIEPKNRLAPVLKSNAYGHGLFEVAKILRNKSDFFVIDSYFEALDLRHRGIDTPLLIIGFVRPEVINDSRLKNVSFTVGSLDLLYAIKTSVKIHLKIDTGMHRQGILIQEIDTAIRYLKSNRNIVLEGICSHLSDSDGLNPLFTNQQIDQWNSIVENFKKEFPSIKYVHLSNTFGHKFTDKINANTSRLGIGLYGMISFPNLKLRPVLEMKTIVTSVKEIPAGDFVGYNNTFNAKEQIKIATIPTGYYEGVDRRLSNKGMVKVLGAFCPIIGRVSMNITTIDVSVHKAIKIGDEVTVISNNSFDQNSIESIAKTCDTIPYEISVHIPQHLKRIVVL